MPYADLEQRRACARDAARRYRMRNLEAERAADRARYEANRGAINERARAHREGNPDRQAYEREHRAELKAQVIGHYGDRCRCCATAADLAIDHIDGGGRAHRMELFGRQIAGLRFYRWLIKQGFPEGYQVLCRPCNTSKGDGSGCRLNHEMGDSRGAAAFESNN